MSMKKYYLTVGITVYLPESIVSQLREGDFDATVKEISEDETRWVSLDLAPEESE